MVRFDPIYFWCVESQNAYLSAFSNQQGYVAYFVRNGVFWSLFWWSFSIKYEDYFRELWFLETNYIGWWCGLWRISLKPNWKWKVLINGCDTCFDDILDKMKELQELQKIMICDLLLVNSACACIQVQLNYDSKKKGSVIWQRENRQICWCVRYIGRLFAPVTQGSKCACSAKRSDRIGIHPARKYSGLHEVQLVPTALYIYMNIHLTILTSNFFHT